MDYHEKKSLTDVHISQSTLQNRGEYVKELEQKLRQAEEKYQTLFDSIDEGFCIVEVLFDASNTPIDYRFLEVNAAFEQQTGIKNPIGKRMRDIAPNHENYWFEIYGKIALTGEAQRFKNAARQLNYVYNVYAFRVGDPAHRKVGILFSDITEQELAKEEIETLTQRHHIERARTDEALRQSDAYYKAIIKQSIAGIVKLDLSGRIVFSNERFGKMLGYDYSELLQTNFITIVHQEDVARNNELFETLISKGAAYEVEKRLIRKDGTTLWVNNYVSPILDSTGHPDSVVVISVEITRQKAIEKQKDDFIGIASHELKTPITSIKAYSQLLKKKFSQGAVTKDEDFINRLNFQVDRLSNLVHTLLDTTKITSGSLILNKEVFDLNELIEERIQEAQVVAPDHHILFQKGHIAPLLADRERIGQVLANLISNAIKYSPSGGDVIVSSAPTDGGIKVGVKDFGIGISEDAQQKVFERFYRVNGTPAELINGIGLGLYISMEIIKKHNGFLSVESAPNEGALFYFELTYATS